MQNRPSAVNRHRGAVRLSRSKKRAPIIRPEDLTFEQRAALAQKLKAAQQRRRPPSI
jgi:hypothetical protein